MSAITSIDTTAAAAAQTGAQKSLAGNFDTFLTLLTTQLQNQDPMNPMDSNQFTQQLVEFSQVEQQINTNDNLKTLIGLGTNRNAADAVSYLGKAVTVSNGQAALAGGQATWNYALGSTAANTTLSITDASGKVVYTGAGETTSGLHTFNWDGKDTNGNQLPDGAYTLKINATDASGDSVGTAMASGGVVTEVDMSGSEPILLLGGALPIKLSDISSIGTIASSSN
ncbi:MAG TPA: flagellar hook assembly protein FlgD [Rhizomicrobium sp.]|jgi:flagellar basal-body rod modification protein FlgD|nr:flagellar hook assembly protein FlgD [Rhizomicrobium sp.]